MEPVFAAVETMKAKWWELWLARIFGKIAEHYGGNNSACARAYGVERNQVQQWLNAKNPVYVIDGALVKLVRTAPGR